MTKVVYITGCLGFIGSYITSACLDRGWYVRGIDKMTYAADLDVFEEFQKYPNFVFEGKDINDLDFLYECDYIINTAAETHVGNSIVNSDEFIKTNVNGVHKLLELIKSYRQESSKKPVLLHFSTDEVYGDIDKGAHTETDLLKPSNPYSASKAAADMLILAWGRTYNLPYLIVRPTNNYGVGQYVEKLIPKACKYLSLDKKIPLHNGGTPVRNWLYAEDTARAVILLIERGIQNEIYNIAGGFEQSNYDTVTKVIQTYHRGEHPAEQLPVDWYLDFTYSRAGQDVRYALDDSKLRTLGWRPEADFDKELIGIVNHYKKKFIW